MEKPETIQLIKFFKSIEISEEDVTTPEEKVNGQLVLIVTYKYQGKEFKTNKLFYKDISPNSEKKNIVEYFASPVYWLDKDDQHDWPNQNHNLNETIIKEIVPNGNIEFENFLKELANDSKSGAIFEIMQRDGYWANYHFNLFNNNHWHDIVKLIKAFIKSKGEDIDKSFFSKLVFRWEQNNQNDRRSSLSTYFGPRKFITELQKNIKMVQPELLQEEIKTLLEKNFQVILQGPPGTGKTRMAKLVSEKIISDSLNIHLKEIDIIKYLKEGLEIKTITNYNTFKIIALSKDSVKIIPTGSQSEFIVYFQEIIDCFNTLGWPKIVSDFHVAGKGTYIVGLTHYIRDEFIKPYHKIIQFHPAYSYEDFVRGIVTKTIGEKISYEVENKILAEMADNACKNPEKKYILIIDEINRANLPAVLGELIYALEYRGEEVESMYALKEGEKENRTIILPKNFFIIGTMNTADRSVGNIDYALRRRFVFDTILPNRNVDRISNDARNLFTKVMELFVENVDDFENNRGKSSKYLSDDFNFEDVIIGHSYFIGDNETVKNNLEHKVMPLLKEYIKDGVLKKESIEEELKKLLIE